MRQRFSRLHEIHRIRGMLEREGNPRLQMSLLVTITGVAGFISSYTLLQAGLNEMWIRYLVAIGIAYIVFLFLLWLWLRTKADDYSDIPDLPSFIPLSNRSDPVPTYCGKGGEFGGGGASSSFDSPTEPIHLESAPSSTDAVSETLGTAAGAEEFSIPLAALILAGTLLFSSFFIVYSAPVLFAELLVDGVLAASLYRRLRGLEARHWLETALHRTFWPFIFTALFVAVSGWAMELYAPGARSVGDVLYHARHQQ